MDLPPKILRRIILAPAFVVVTIVAVTALPIELIVAAFASRYVPGRWRPLRLAWFAVLWMVIESVVIVALFGLWLASGFGSRIGTEMLQDAHYRLIAWFLRMTVGSARRTFGLKITIDEPLPAEGAHRPLLVFARHAGPGDSFLLVDALLNRAGRRPSIVLKDTLQWDPAIDIALNRLPSRFVSTHTRAGTAAIDAIAALAARLGPSDALIIFPEGGNFTPGRRTSAIEKLRAAGLAEFASRASAMTHLLPPKPDGVLTAIRNAPDAMILLVGHAGLETMSTLADIWYGLHMDIMVRTRYWSALASDLPAGEPELQEWIYDQWAEMNTWLDGSGSSPAT